MALMGANGAGKTTLLRVLACLTSPSSGSARVEGWDIERDAQRVRRVVGFVAHQPYLYDELTAEENLLFFGKMYAVKDARKRTKQLLLRVGMEKRAGERVSVLSRGQVQRLALARALLHAPRLLLLDEPDTGLDEEGQELVEQVLAEHSAGGGAVLCGSNFIASRSRMGSTMDSMFDWICAPILCRPSLTWVSSS